MFHNLHSTNKLITSISFFTPNRFRYSPQNRQLAMILYANPCPCLASKVLSFGFSQIIFGE